MNTAQAGGNYAVKADYLVKFSDYVTNWPSSAGTLVFCVAGDDPFGAALDQALQSRKRQDGKKLQARRIDGGGSQGCHVLFAASPGQARAGKGTLTVSDAPGFAQNGGMIGFVMDGKSVRFEMNERAIKASGLKLSAKLWDLAHKRY